MFRRIFPLFLLVILLLGVFRLAGRGSYQEGWTDGYFTGREVAAAQAAADGDETVYAPPSPVQREHRFPGAIFLLPLLCLGFFGLLFLSFIFKLGRCRRHGHKWGKWEKWSRGDQMPPWHNPEEPVVKV